MTLRLVCEADAGSHRAPEHAFQVSVRAWPLLVSACTAVHTRVRPAHACVGLAYHALGGFHCPSAALTQATSSRR
eukprot:715038-Pelagomonas_calceolata.AAC.3